MREDTRISSMHVKNFENHESNRKKKRKKDKHFINDEFKNTDVSTVDQLKNALSPISYSEHHVSRKKEKQQQTVVIELEPADKDLNNTVDSLEDNDYGTNDKKKKRKVTKDCELIEFELADKDLDNTVDSLEDNDYGTNDKKKKGKVTKDCEFLVSDEINPFIDNSIELENTFDTALMFKSKTHKSKHQADRNKNNVQTAEKDLDNTIPFTTEAVDLYDCTYRSSGKKKEKYAIASEFKNDDTSIQKYKIEQLGIINSSDITNHVEYFEDHKDNRKKKRKTKEYFISDEFRNTNVSIVNQLQNSLNPILVSEHSLSNKKKKKRQIEIKEQELQLADNTMDLSEDYDSGTSDRKKGKVTRDAEFPVSKEMRNSTFVENSVELSKSAFDTAELLKSKSHRKKEYAEENITKDDGEKLHIPEIRTEEDFSGDSEESRFYKKRKKWKLYNHSTPNPIQNINLGFQNAPQLLETSPDVSCIAKPGKSKMKFLDWESDGAQGSMHHMSVTSNLLDSSDDIIYLSSDDTNKVNKKKKVKHDQHKATVRNTCEKEKTVDDCTSVNENGGTSNPMEFPDVEWSLSSQKNTSVNNLQTNSVTDQSSLKPKAPKKTFPSSPENQLDLHAKSSPSEFFVPNLDDDEDPVDFTIPPLHESEAVSTLTKDKKAFFESQGITIKLGRWLPSEDAILRRNYNQFCGQFKINDPYVLLGVGQSRRSAEVVRFIKAKHFYVRLGQDLDSRPLHSIYLRARALFHPLRKTKKCTKDDISTVKQVYNRVGNNWCKIGAMLDKKSSMIRESHRWNQKPVVKGTWTSEEEENLINAIKSVAKTSEISAKLIKRISWEAVAELVPTRNFSQCRLHWGECMSWDPNVTERSIWSGEHDNELIEIIKNEHLKDETEIDWEDIHKSFKAVAPSYMFLQKKWRRIKRSAKYFEAVKRLFAK